MTVASEIQRIKNGMSAAYSKLEEKGATIPSNPTVDDLADIIDSVPAGGGGGGTFNIYDMYDDFRESEFDAAIADLDTYLPNNFNQSDSNTNSHHVFTDYLESKGWVEISNASSTKPTVITITFSSNVDVVNIASVCAYKVPSSVTVVQNSSNTSYYTFTFTGDERTIQILVSASVFLSRYYFKNGSLSDLGTGLIRGFAIKGWSTTSVSIHDFTKHTFKQGYSSAGGMQSKLSFLLNGTKYIEPSNWKLYFADMFYGNYGTTSQLVSYTNIVNVVKEYLSIGRDILEHSADTLTSDGYIAFNNDCLSDVYKIVGSTAYFGYASNSLTDLFAQAGKTKVPFVLDMSQYSSTQNHWHLFYTNASSTLAQGKYLTDIRLKLPSTCTNVYLSATYYNGSSLSSIPLNLESYQYIATNAPSVSSKTLHVGYPIINYMNSNDDWATVKTTLEGKGWTVAS